MPKNRKRKYGQISVTPRKPSAARELPYNCNESNSPGIDAAVFTRSLAKQQKDDYSSSNPIDNQIRVAIIGAAGNIGLQFAAVWANSIYSYLIHKGIKKSEDFRGRYSEKLADCKAITKLINNALKHMKNSRAKSVPSIELHLVLNGVDTPNTSSWKFNQAHGFGFSSLEVDGPEIRIPKSDFDALGITCLSDGTSNYPDGIYHLVLVAFGSDFLSSDVVCKEISRVCHTNGWIVLTGNGIQPFHLEQSDDPRLKSCNLITNVTENDSKITDLLGGVRRIIGAVMTVANKSEMVDEENDEQFYLARSSRVSNECYVDAIAIKPGEDKGRPITSEFFARFTDASGLQCKIPNCFNEAFFSKFSFNFVINPISAILPKKIEELIKDNKVFKLTLLLIEEYQKVVKEYFGCDTRTIFFGKAFALRLNKSNKHIPSTGQCVLNKKAVEYKNYYALIDIVRQICDQRSEKCSSVMPLSVRLYKAFKKVHDSIREYQEDIDKSGEEVANKNFERNKKDYTKLFNKLLTEAQIRAIPRNPTLDYLYEMYEKQEKLSEIYIMSLEDRAESNIRDSLKELEAIKEVSLLRNDCEKVDKMNKAIEFTKALQSLLGGNDGIIDHEAILSENLSKNSIPQQASENRKRSRSNSFCSQKTDNDVSSQEDSDEEGVSSSCLKRRGYNILVAGDSSIREDIVSKLKEKMKQDSTLDECSIYLYSSEDTKIQEYCHELLDDEPRKIFIKLVNEKELNYLMFDWLIYTDDTSCSEYHDLGVGSVRAESILAANLSNRNSVAKKFLEKLPKIGPSHVVIIAAPHSPSLVRFFSEYGGVQSNQIFGCDITTNSLSFNQKLEQVIKLNCRDNLASVSSLFFGYNKSNALIVPDEFITIVTKNRFFDKIKAIRMVVEEISSSEISGNLTTKHADIIADMFASYANINCPVTFSVTVLLKDFEKSLYENYKLDPCHCVGLPVRISKNRIDLLGDIKLSEDVNNTLLEHANSECEEFNRHQVQMTDIQRVDLLVQNLQSVSECTARYELSPVQDAVDVYNSGEMIYAKDLFSSALKAARDERQKLIIYCCLAMAYVSLGEYEEAISIYRAEAADIWLKLHKRDDEDLKNITNLVNDLLEITESSNLIQKEEHHALATGFGNTMSVVPLLKSSSICMAETVVGAWKAELEDKVESNKMIHCSSISKSLPAEHASCKARLFNNVGLLLFELRQYEKAVYYFNLAANRYAEGDKYYKVIPQLNSALSLSYQGDSYHECALRIIEETKGGINDLAQPLISAAFDNIRGLIYYKNKNYQEAKECFGRVLVALKAYYGSNMYNRYSLYVAQAGYNYARALVLSEPLHEENCQHAVSLVKVSCGIFNKNNPKMLPKESIAIWANQQSK